MPAGAYTLNLDYRNAKGDLPANYAFVVKVKVNGKPITASQDGSVRLPVDGKAPWHANFPVTLPGGVTTISVEWTNDNTEDPTKDVSFTITELSLTSKQATEASAKRDDQRRNALNQYRTALAKYVADNGKYPTQNQSIGMTASNEPFRSLQGKYLQSVPERPGYEPGLLLHQQRLALRDVRRPGD